MKRVALFLATLGLAASLVGVVSAQPVNRPAPLGDEAPLTQEDRDAVLKGLERIVTQFAFVPGADFSQWPAFIEKERENIDKADTPARLALTINRALDKFGVSHIALMTPDSARRMRDNKIVGIGIRANPTAEGIRIAGVLPGSPAELGGIKEGDTIVKVDGKPAEVGLIAGAEGTEVTLQVKGADGKTREVKLTRKTISTAQPETLKWINPTTAHIVVPSFMTYKPSNVKSLFQDAHKADTIILDLRNNGGGSVLNLMHLAGFFLKSDQPMGTFLDRGVISGYAEETKADPKTLGKDLAKVAEWAKSKFKPTDQGELLFKGRVICLINGGSGSASEIMAAALKEVAGAEIIGTKSAGMVLGSTFAPVGRRGFQLQFPINDYVTIKGLRLEGNGVTPNIPAANPEPGAKTDPAIEAALKWIAGEKPGAKAAA